MIDKIKNRICSSGRNQKRGFSLVELLICIILLSIIATSVGVMLTSGTNMYTGINKYAVVSYRSQLAMSQIKEFCIDCNGVCVDGNKVYLTKYEAGSLRLYCFTYDPSENRIILNEADQTDLPNDIVTFNTADSQPFSTKVSSVSVVVGDSVDNLHEHGYVVAATRQPYICRASTLVIDLGVSSGSMTYNKRQVISLKGNPVYINAADIEKLADGTSVPLYFVKVVRDLMGGDA